MSEDRRKLSTVRFAMEHRTEDDPNRSKAEKHAIYLALAGIERAEETILSASRWIRDDLDRVERYMADDFGLNESGELGRKPVELDTACAQRKAHWEALNALLSKDEMQDYFEERWNVRHPEATEAEKLARHLRRVHEQVRIRAHEADDLDFLRSLHHVALEQNKDEMVTDGPRACSQF